MNYNNNINIINDIDDIDDIDIINYIDYYQTDDNDHNIHMVDIYEFLLYIFIENNIDFFIYNNQITFTFVNVNISIWINEKVHHYGTNFIYIQLDNNNRLVSNFNSLDDFKNLLCTILIFLFKKLPLTRIMRYEQ